MSMRSVQGMDIGYAPPAIAAPSARVGTAPPPALGASVHAMSPSAAAAGDHAVLIAWLVLFGALVLLRVAAEAAHEE